MTKQYVAADPYPWPYDGDLRPANTALVIIDLQTDFCGPGGYVDTMGYDLALTRAPLEPLAALLAAMRRQGFHVLHTREGHRPDLADCPGTSSGVRGGSARASAIRALRPHPGARRARLGDHPGAAPLTGEPIIDKPGKGSFYATDLELVLRTRGIATWSSPASPRMSACIRPCGRPTTGAMNACCSTTAAARPTDEP